MLKNHLDLSENYKKLQNAILLQKSALVARRIHKQLELFEAESCKTNTNLTCFLKEYSGCFANFHNSLNLPMERTKSFLDLVDVLVEFNKRFKEIQHDLEPEQLQQYLDKTSKLNLTFKEFINHFVQIHQKEILKIKSLVQNVEYLIN